MKKATLCAWVTALLLGLALDARGQEGPSQAELIEKRDKKLQSEFLKKASWVMGYEEAMAKSTESNKLILGYFTRSYSP